MEKHHIIKDLPSKQQFHSALLTTYSLDFYHLEQRMVSQLRSRGIRNITVVADARIVEECLTTMGMNVKKASSLYTLNTVSCNGAFHPKIHMYVGDNAIMLLIGSGNLSSGGAGKNDELFIQLYADSEKRSQLPLIVAAWRYLQSVCNEFKGISAEQLTWMQEHCSLLPDNPLDSSGREEYFNIGQDIEAAFLATDSVSLWQKLQPLLPDGLNVKKITMVSPYFDKKGKLLSTLLATFPKASVDVIVQEDRALLPTEFTRNKHVNFYSWNDTGYAKNSDEKKEKFVHGKLFHFQLPNEEYLVIGSANATDRAFFAGSSANREAVLLLRGKDKDWLRELGLTGYKHTIDIWHAKPILALNEPKPGIQFKCKLAAIDIGQNYCRLFLSLPLQEPFMLELYTATNRLVFRSKPLISAQVCFTIEGGDWQSVLYGMIVNNRHEQVSNRQVVNNVQAIWNNNPAPENRKLQYLMEKISGNDYTEFDLFDYFDVIYSDVYVKPKITSHNRRADNEDVTGPTTSYEEAKKKLEDPLLDGQIKKFEVTTRVVESYLDKLKRDLEREEEDNIDDEEEGNIANGRKREQKEKIQKPLRSEDVFKRLSKKISDFYTKYTGKLADSQGDYEVRQSDYAFFILALSHLIAVSGRSRYYLYKETRLRGELISYEGPVHTYSSFASIYINVIGKFLAFVQYALGDQSYKGEYDTRRLKHFKQMALNSLLLAMTVYYQKCNPDHYHARKWQTLVMLNVVDVWGEDIDICEAIAKQRTVLNLWHLDLDNGMECVRSLFDDTISLYRDIKNSSLTNNIERHRIVYIDGFGFSYVVKAIPNIRAPKCLKLANLGAEFNIDDFVWDDLYHIERDEFLQSKQQLATE